MTARHLQRHALVVLTAWTSLFVATAGSRLQPAASIEAATARYFASIRNQPLLLLAFLAEMPKGGDLHNHLTGAVYAESYLRWAAEDGLCLATTTMTLVAATCDAAAGQPPVTAVLRNATLFNQAIDAMSMRHWNPALNGHDHFFATFGKFGPPSDKTGDMIAEVVARAAAERISYLELMLTPDGGAAAQRGRAAGWDPDFGRQRDRLLAGGFQDVVAEARRRIGHGGGVMYEDDPLGLLREMAARRVLVEVALTSNDLILGIKGTRHPLRMFLKYGVPVALVTDDAGVARSSLTLEFRRAVEEQGLDYATLKRMVRNSLEYAFADDATRTRLRADLQTAFRAFEHRIRNREPG